MTGGVTEEVTMMTITSRDHSWALGGHSRLGSWGLQSVMVQTTASEERLAESNDEVKKSICI